MKAIKMKDKGVEVKVLQTYLNVTPDGIFGSITRAAVNSWKESLGMALDGEISEIDWSVIAQSLPTIRQGVTGKEVKMLQLILGIDVDGQFGPATKASVRAFQATNNLSIDGIVGKKTWNALFTSNINTTNVKPTDYKQYDSRWGSVIYTQNNTYNKKQTIKNSGCGPTAMADIVSTWWDKNVTPATLAALSVMNGYRTKNSGTAWDFFKFCAEKYGASKFIQTSSYTTAANALKNGAYVVASMGPGLYTKGGHYICWWKTDGTYNYVNDPASAASSRAKSACNIIKSQAKQFFIFYK